MQVSMSGISVSEDAVNLFYYMKAKSTVRPASCARVASHHHLSDALLDVAMVCVLGMLLVAAYSADGLH